MTRTDLTPDANWQDWFFQGRGAERFAQDVGLDTAQTRTLLETALPRQLAALQSHAAAGPGRSQLLEAAANIPRFPSVDAAFSTTGGAADLRRAGELLAPALMGERHNELVRELTLSHGAKSTDVSHLLHLSLPLLISRFSQYDGAAATLLPPLLDGTKVVSATPEVVVTEGAPVVAAPVAVPPAPPPPVTQVTTTTETRRKGLPLWLLLLPLLLLGGCWLANQNRNETATVTTTAAAATPFDVTTPEDGATVSAGGFSVQGTAPAGGAYSVLRGGTEVGNFTAGNDGTWNVDVVDAAAPPGETTYTFRNADGEEVGTLPLTIAAADAGESTDFAVTSPGDGAEVAASGFSVQGTGPAGEGFSVLRDDAEIGNFTVGDDGSWNVDIVDAAAPAGEATYTFRNAAGEEVGTLPLTVTAAEATGAQSGEVAAPGESFAVTSPSEGADVPASGFAVEGTGPVGERFTVLRGDAEVGNFTVGDTGTWQVDVVDGAASAGETTYTFRNAEGEEVGTLPVTVTTDATGNAAQTDEAQTPVAVEVTVQEPAEGAEVPASGFDLSGTGTPGAGLQLFENGTSVGSFVVGDDGNWTVDVPGPELGERTYDILDERGNRVASLPLTVVAPEAQACTGDLTINVAEGERVSAPFRIGGQGPEGDVVVTVWRGERQIGEQRVAVTPACTWSYVSRPGGREDVVSQVRYEVRSAGTQGIQQRITLNVSGSGVNFNDQGEYVGPTD